MEDFRSHILAVLNTADAFALAKQQGLPFDSEERALLLAVGSYSAARIRAGSAAWQADAANAVRQLATGRVAPVEACPDPATDPFTLEDN
jgi:hypothetical protein